MEDLELRDRIFLSALAIVFIRQTKILCDRIRQADAETGTRMREILQRKMDEQLATTSEETCRLFAEHVERTLNNHNTVCEEHLESIKTILTNGDKEVLIQIAMSDGDFRLELASPTSGLSEDDKIIAITSRDAERERVAARKLRDKECIERDTLEREIASNLRILSTFSSQSLEELLLRD